jgi:hypothetical protein
MAQNSVISTDVYFFNSVGNKFVRKQLESIPLPAKFSPIAAGGSPDPSVYVYSKINYGTNFQQEAYSAETVAQLQTKANA